MDEAVIKNIIMMLASALVILLFFLPPSIALTVAGCVGLVLLDLVGHLMVGWDVKLNLVSLMEIIMAVGFAVDYSAHIAHGFATADQRLSRDEQVSEALQELGVPV
jgi:predicted RND superfamily exporter protein